MFKQCLKKFNKVKYLIKVIKKIHTDFKQVNLRSCVTVYGNEDWCKFKFSLIKIL